MNVDIDAAVEAHTDRLIDVIHGEGPQSDAEHETKILEEFTLSARSRTLRMHPDELDDIVNKESVVARYGLGWNIHQWRTMAVEAVAEAARDGEIWAFDFAGEIAAEGRDAMFSDAVNMFAECDERENAA